MDSKTLHIMLVRHRSVIKWFLFISLFYLRDAMLARVIGITTCLSVRLSVTRPYCVTRKLCYRKDDRAMRAI